MKVLVTGAGGYIGTVLVPLLLSKGYEVIALDRFFFGKTLQEDKGLKIVDDDIRFVEPDVLRGVDAVIDLAALSNDPSGELDPIKTWSINYLGRFRIANLAKRMGVKRYILPSSCSVYGFREDIADETSSTNPLTTYAKANLKGEKDILPLADKNFTVTVFRIATVYGYAKTRRMRFDLVINAFVRDLVTKNKIFVMKDGTQWRPFVHVWDVANAFTIALEKETINGEVFNLGSDDQNYQIFDLAVRISKALNKELNYEWYGSPDKRSYRVSFKKLKEKFGYVPKYRVEDAAVEISKAILSGELDPNDPRYITVSWYKKLISEGVLV
ncbi:NAD-dependent epimerase/dehydratase family protein [Sulfolobus sp. E5-1-F]|uniref:NAD-dependent epimerase/dehydratase family protein n=1 Tax=Saccharolobus sp. E5-1-F TaxID=2663019 RepID=UPI0012959688|nr:SDR family oxidoreductase [Sulfolobus sp. E5-1-F]QGA53803.1 NAD-dependent epimerase/dehydratase family protein [Sulfolobus sp. E5-1-F]